MHLNDCFVRGCDGSNLIASTNSERTAPPNRSLRGYYTIDDVKARLEAVCPNTISCADILALAARDFIILSGGPTWEVPLGRLDGRVSQASDVNVPIPSDHISILKEKFIAKGLTAMDLVTLIVGKVFGAGRVMSLDAETEAVMERFVGGKTPSLLLGPLLATSITKMSLIDIKTNLHEGEIRRVCSVVN